MKIFEILDAWITSFHPTKEEIEKAEYRASICETCEYKEELNNGILQGLTANDKLLNKFKCSQCGCPISKKLFAFFKESCPIHKWEK